MHQSVWIEDLTWLEVRDNIRAGMTTAIIPTGGIEQNGPFLTTDKHNVILQATGEAIARKLGNALITPIVAFVPQGPVDQIRYPGTLSVSPETFKQLLADISESLRSQGFRNVILIGDSGGNQQAMAELAARLSEQWKGSGAQIHYIPEYYNWPERQQWLRDRGINEEIQPGWEGLHDEYSATSIMMTVNPTKVRMNQRLAEGLFSIHGVDLAPAEKTIGVGEELIDWIATVTVNAINGRLGSEP
jgi:creatinine amidohydrolase/Fe(II)-dependent formamide hydrolase-like protein